MSFLPMFLTTLGLFFVTYSLDPVALGSREGVLRMGGYLLLGTLATFLFDVLEKGNRRG